MKVHEIANLIARLPAFLDGVLMTGLGTLGQADRGPPGTRGRKRAVAGKLYTPNGPRERARRVRQIAAGILRVSQ